MPERVELKAWSLQKKPRGPKPSNQGGVSGGFQGKRVQVEGARGGEGGLTTRGRGFTEKAAGRNQELYIPKDGSKGLNPSVLGVLVCVGRQDQKNKTQEGRKSSRKRKTSFVPFPRSKGEGKWERGLRMG